jgi:hypothetical protein
MLQLHYCVFIRPLKSKAFILSVFHADTTNILTCFNSYSQAQRYHKPEIGIIKPPESFYVKRFCP